MTSPSADLAPRARELLPEVAIVVPVYQNSPTLVRLHQLLGDAMQAAGVSDWEVTYVDDGSRDDSLSVLRSLHAAHANVRVLRLSRNFGSMAAIQAGLAQAQGRATAVIAADLQDPPELLTEMVQQWRAGAEVVVASRHSRDDPWTSRALSWGFYKVFRTIVSPEMPTGGFDFFLIDRKVQQVLTRSAEKNANVMAALLWVGFRRVVLKYHRRAREHGRSMWTFWKKVKFMYDSLLSYSYVPLRVISTLGMIGMACSLGYAALITYERLTGGIEAPGWSSLMVVTLFFSGTLLTAVGLVGEYVWRTFDAARARPLYIVAELDDTRSDSESTSSRTGATSCK